MLKIDNEGSDDDSDTPINKSATNTPKKVDPNECGAANAQPIHVNNVNNAIIGNAGTPLQALPKVPLPYNPYTHYT